MADTTHLVITVHGIRTYGDWQDELKTLLEAAEPGVTVRMYRYGFFSSLAFLLPPVRWLMGRQFRSFFENEVRSAPEGRGSTWWRTVSARTWPPQPSGICPRGE